MRQRVIIVFLVLCLTSLSVIPYPQVVRADDTSEIQALLDALPASGGEVNLDGARTYVLTNVSGQTYSLKMKSNQTINGHGAVIKVEDNHNADFKFIVNDDQTNSNYRITIKNVVFNGNKLNQSSGNYFAVQMVKIGYSEGSNFGLRIEDVDFVDFENSLDGIINLNRSIGSYIKARFLNISGGGITFEGGETDANRDNVLDSPVFINVGDGRAISAVNSTRLTIKNPVIVASGSGIVFDHTTYSTITGGTIKITAASYPVYLAAGSNFNKINGVTTKGGGRGFTIDNSHWNNINGTATYATYYGFVAENDSDYNHMSGVSYRNGNEGFLVIGKLNGSDVLIGNSFTDFLTQENGHHGVSLIRRAIDTLVANGQSFANGQAIDDTYNGIFIDSNSDKNKVTNVITRKGDGVKQSKHGILVNTPDSEGNILNDNDVRDGGKTSNLQDNGTSTIKRDNDGA